MKRFLLAGLLMGLLLLPTAPLAAQVEIPNPIACDNAACLIGQIIRYILGIIAILATFMFIWGGVTMMTSAGNAERVRQAKETLAWAAIGVVMVLISWAVIRFVLEGIVGNTS